MKYRILSKVRAADGLGLVLIAQPIGESGAEARDGVDLRVPAGLRCSVLKLAMSEGEVWELRLDSDDREIVVEAYFVGEEQTA